MGRKKYLILSCDKKRNRLLYLGKKHTTEVWLLAMVVRTAWSENGRRALSRSLFFK